MVTFSSATVTVASMRAALGFTLACMLLTVIIVVVRTLEVLLCSNDIGRILLLFNVPLFRSSYPPVCSFTPDVIQGSDLLSVCNGSHDPSRPLVGCPWNPRIFHLPLLLPHSPIIRGITVGALPSLAYGVMVRQWYNGGVTRE